MQSGLWPVSREDDCLENRISFEQCSNGEKEEPERSVSERQRREARRRRPRGSSAEGARSFNAARGSGERCKLPQRVWVEPGHQTTFGAFLVWKCLIWQGRRFSYGVWGSAVGSVSGFGRSLAAKLHLVHLWSENALSGKALASWNVCLVTFTMSRVVLKGP